MEKIDGQEIFVNGSNEMSEKEMLDLFKVEELENRLEMAAISSSKDLQLAADTSNGVCWIGDIDTVAQ